MVVKYIFIILLIASFISGCKPQYTKTDIIGTWVSKDGAKLQFMNGTFHAQYMPYEMFRLIRSLPNNSNLCYSGSGFWIFFDDDHIILTFDSLYKSSSSSQDDLGSTKKHTSLLEGSHSIQLEIHSQQDSHYMYYIIGDPDSMDYYKFSKAK